MRRPVGTMGSFASRGGADATIAPTALREIHPQRVRRQGAFVA